MKESLYFNLGIFLKKELKSCIDNMTRKYRNPSSRYENYEKKGKKPRKSWRRRRRERIERQKRTEEIYRHRYRSILMYIFARKRKKSETLEEYRLRLMNLELITFIVLLLILLFFWIPR